MGYTPVYDSMLTGTLYGRWPHTGIWACLLSRATREGVIDEVPASIAAAIGVPVATLLECIEDFMLPDPGSRTKDYEGRRLVLVDPNRDWGWKILNHGKYREKARKASFDSSRTEDGRNSERMASRKQTREDPRRPAKTRRDPLSEAEADSKRERTKRTPRAPKDFQPDLDYAKTQIPDIDPDREAQKFRDWEFKTPRSDWQAVWRNWIERCKETGKYAKVGAGGIQWQ